MYHLGFTFSYPCEQKAINHGVLQRWTKGFDIKGVEGHDVVPMFEAALKKRGVPIKVTAVVNVIMRTPTHRLDVFLEQVAPFVLFVCLY